MDDIILILITVSEPGICVCLQNHGEPCHPEEHVDESNVNLKRQRFTSCYHDKRKTSFVSGNGMTASNAASQLNSTHVAHGISRNNVELQMEEVHNKTETDGGQPVIRNEIRHTTYR